MEGKLEGIDGLLKNFGALGVEIEGHALNGLKKAGMSIIADAQSNLRANGSIVFGRLAHSGKTQVLLDKSGVDVGFFAKDSENGYAEYVEYGTRGVPARKKMPPPAALAMWGKRKFGLKDEEAESFGWAKAMNILRYGTPPKPFFHPAVEKNTPRIAEAMSTAIRSYFSKLFKI